MLEKIEKILSRVSFILALFSLTLLIIDQINSAMGFISNQGTKIIMMIFCISTAVLAGMKIIKK